MRTHRRATAAAVAALLGSLSLLGAGSAPATAADTSTRLPVSSFRDIVVDGVHDRVFISDPSGGSIVVTDYAGAVVQHITAEDGAAGLALSKDSSKVYVALSSAGAISEIDTSTLTETRRYPIGADVSPQNLALAGGKLWFGYAVGSSGDIGSLDLSGTDPVVTLDLTSTSWYYAPSLASSPADPNVLVAGQEGVSPATLAVYEATATGLQQRANRLFTQDPQVSFLNDFAVTADGQNIVMAANNPSAHEVVRTSDLSANGSYSSWAFPNAVAVATDGTLATGASDYAVQTYRPGSTVPLHTYFEPDDLQRDGLAWAPDDNRLFTVSGDVVPTLHVLPDAGKTESTLTLEAPSTIAKNRALTVNGTLSAFEPFAGTPTVEVTRTDTESPNGTPLGTFLVSADGRFQFTDRPRMAGQTTYTARYAGDTQHIAATTEVTVNVTK
ncbi:hypothetical protein G5C60_42720 [Streptomyces sp. HC44]|uniref:Ig-like domain repeat protein n=1 Tax=Streptomyces scabichelini TaxID=2711217 RepID=A0A6G4VK07_9ACTN|nr:hypothetical protein [Streptomyces scabichelini]NGO14134.1 hypothetical protein [Streptomyces scabichelini]